MIIGYARVSTEQQSLNRQIDRLQEAHCERIFSDKVSGTKKDRPEFTMMMNTIREGDIIIVCELSRLSRKVKDIFAIVDKIHELGADIKSLKEEWLDTTTPTGKLLFTFIAGISKSFTLAEIEMRTGVKRPTLYLYLNRRKNGEL